MSTAAMLLGLALAASPATQTANPVDSADKKYEITFEGTSKDVKMGKDGTFAMCIKPKPGFKISNEAPLKVKLSSDGLKLKKNVLKSKDAKAKWEKSPEFAVAFGAEKSGAQKVDVNATFFVCDVKICERKTEKLTVAVSVSP